MFKYQLMHKQTNRGYVISLGVHCVRSDASFTQAYCNCGILGWNTVYYCPANRTITFFILRTFSL